MPDFDDDAAWKSRNAAFISPEDTFFTDNARRRWEKANVPGDTILQANKLSMGMSTAFSPLRFLQMRFSATPSVVCAALFGHFLSLTSIWIDMCLVMAYNIVFWLVVSYKTNTGRSFGFMTSRLIHVSSRQNMAHNSWLWSYLVIKCAIMLAWEAARLGFTIMMRPSYYTDIKTLAITAALAITASIVRQSPQRLISCADWFLAKLWQTLGCAFLLTVYIYKSLTVWTSHMHDAGMLLAQKYWPLTNFEYAALPPGKIRLLELPRKLPLRGIQARLLVVSLEEATMYEAISYTWGNCTERRSILLQGKRFTTTRTAWEALNAHSSSWRSTTVWIDQICINQADDEEKGQQVAMMFDIYRGADRVVAHLGTSPTASAAVSMLSELMWQEFQDSDVEIAGFLHTTSFFRDYAAIKTMLQHPWFSRVWVVQEVAAAKEFAVAYGGYMLDWESMASAIRVLMRPAIRDPLISDPRHLEKIMRQSANVLEMMVIGRQVRLNLAGGHVVEVLKLTPAYSLPWMLKSTINFMATDARDKIYALQSISLPSRLPYGDPLRFEYDYTKSVEVLYSEVAANVLFHFPDSFYLMSFAGLDKRGDLDLPSWVPDWTTSHKWQYGFTSRLDAQDLSLLDAFSNATKASTNEAGANMTAQKTASYRAGGSSRPVKMIAESSLAIHGVKIGAITNVSQVRSPDLVKDSQQYVDRHGQSMFPIRVKQVSAWLHEARVMAREVYENSTACDDAFWRTLIGDRWQDARPASSEARDAYLAWEYTQACWLLACAQLDAGESDVELPRHDLFYRARSFESAWFTAFGNCAAHRSFATIAGKYVAIVPQCTQIGDVVIVPLGARTPWVLRPVDTEVAFGSGCFQFVGEAYVNGLMDGECITPSIALGAKVLSIYFAKEVKKRMDAQDGGERTEPEWVEIMAKNDLIMGSQEDIGDTSSIADEDVIHYRSDGMVDLPGCEWFMLE